MKHLLVGFDYLGNYYYNDKATLTQPRSAEGSLRQDARRA